jgi:thiamine-monophosphate kinase
MGLALAGLASSAIDVSDGLLADLGHVCSASGVGAEVALQALPASPGLLARFDAATRARLQAAGGDDYELCFTAPVARRDAIAALAADTGIALARIGLIVAGEGVRATLEDGSAWQPGRAGYAHFDAS